MKELLRWYHAGEKTLHTLAEFHVCYNHIQPFQSGNGRVGRLILFRECLRNGIIPFIMEAENKGNYINSLELAQKGDLEPLEKFFEKEQEVYQKEVEYFI
jgi:Fic family protein